MENFDEDVHTRLRLHQDQTTQQITRFEEWLWRLTQYELGDCAFFDPNGYTFNLTQLPDGIHSDGIALGQYRLITHKNGTEATTFGWDTLWRNNYLPGQQAAPYQSLKSLSATIITER